MHLRKTGDRSDILLDLKTELHDNPDRICKMGWRERERVWIFGGKGFENAGYLLNWEKGYGNI